MFSPRITVEGGHIPVGGIGGLGGGSGYQVRGGLSWSPLDFVHGFMTLDASDTECAQVAALSRARHAIELGAELGELSARRAERDALAASRETWQAVVTRTQTRVTEGLASEPQLSAVRAEAERLERRLDQLDAEIARLVAAGHEDDGDLATLRDDLTTYETSAMQLERQQSSIRRLMPWNVNLFGSVVPFDQGTSGWTVDYYGWVTLSYNLGGIAQQFAEDATIEARADELGVDANELRHGLERFERLLRESLDGLRADLEHVERQLEIQRHQRELLGQLETSEVENLRAMIDLQVVALEAERAHLARLFEVRTAALGSASSGTTLASTGTHDVD